MKTRRKGMLLVISGPSGAGKGTLIKKLLENDPSFVFSVSVTTRAPRETEINHVHYHFITHEEFHRLVEEDAFIEYATVHGNCYGTLKSEVYEHMEKGRNVLLDIDPQGARAVMKKEPECVSVFVLPPSYRKLKERLHTRNTEDPVEIERRFGNARGEIDQLQCYQYAVVNDDLELAFEQLTSIANAEKQRTNRYFPFVED